MSTSYKCAMLSYCSAADRTQAADLEEVAVERAHQLACVLPLVTTRKLRRVLHAMARAASRTADNRRRHFGDIFDDDESAEAGVRETAHRRQC